MFTAVVLRMEVVAELLAVVASTLKATLAAAMTIMTPAIARTIAVALSLVARVLWCTAASSLVVAAGTALSSRRFKWKSVSYGRSRRGGDCGRRLFTAVVLLVVVMAKLPAVVASTDKATLAAAMTIVTSTIVRSIAVALSLIAGLIWRAAAPVPIVTSRTALSRRWFKWYFYGLFFTIDLIFSQGI